MQFHELVCSSFLCLSSSQELRSACLLVTFRQGNLPRVARATVTAGLMWPPDTSELRRRPRMAPIHQLSKLFYTRLQYTPLTLTPNWWRRNLLSNRGREHFERWSHNRTQPGGRSLASCIWCTEVIHWSHLHTRPETLLRQGWWPSGPGWSSPRTS